MAEEQLTGQRKHHHHHHSVTTGQWVSIFFLTLIPVVGLMTLANLAISKHEGSKKNFGKAAFCFRIAFDLIAIPFLYVYYNKIIEVFSM